MKRLKKLLVGTLVLSFFLGVVAMPIDAKGNLNSTNWMKKIPDDTSLKDITIPGTHDSCTNGVGTVFTRDHGAILKAWAKTQDTSITEQLNNGIRLLDFRLEYDDSMYGYNELALCHGDNRLFTCSCNITFYNALYEVRDFLLDHPTETVIISMKNEDYRGMTDKFLEQIKLFRRIMEEGDESGALDIFYTGDTIPTLGEARGKIVILNRMYDDDKKDLQFGIKYDDSTIEDDFELFADEKIVAIEDALEKIEKGQNTKDRAVITYTSTNPITRVVDDISWTNIIKLIAMSGKTETGAYLSKITYTSGVINDWLLNDRDLNKVDCYGWFFMDYPSNALIKKLYKINYRK